MFGVVDGKIVEITCGLDRYTLAPIRMAGRYAIFVDALPVRWYPTIGEATDMLVLFISKWPAMRGRNCRVGIDPAKV